MELNCVWDSQVPANGILISEMLAPCSINTGCNIFIGKIPANFTGLFLYVSNNGNIQCVIELIKLWLAHAPSPMKAPFNTTPIRIKT